MSPTEYDVLPRQWVTIKHRTYGDVIAAMLPYPSLDEGALCAGDPAWTDDESAVGTTTRAYMRAVCDRCPIKPACREYGIAHEGYGMWGGTMPDERKEIRRERKQIIVEPHSAFKYGLTDDYFPMLLNFVTMPELMRERRLANAQSEAVGTSGDSEVA